MPPKTKRQFNAKPGIARQFLCDNYLVPALDDCVLIGHVLCVYVNNEHSIAETVSKLTVILPPGFDIYSLSYSVRKVVEKTLHKFKKLSDEKEFNRFKEICDERFVVKQLETKTQNKTESTDCLLSNSEHEHAESDGTSVEKRQSCGTCASLRCRNQQLKGKLSDLKSELSCTLTCLNQKTPAKVLNQQIKRKDEQIVRWKEKCKREKYAKDDTDVVRELASLKKRYVRLKASRAKCIRDTVLQTSISESTQACDLEALVSSQAATIRSLEDQVNQLRENVENLTSREAENEMLRISKTYSETSRFLVYDCVTNQVPTKNVPALLERLITRVGLQIQVPHRTTVEQMVRELGVLAELQTAEEILRSDTVTVGFDATTQEGVHINSVHITTPKKCCVIAVDELPGGTAEDYKDHICEAFKNMADIYNAVHQPVSSAGIHTTLISKVKNSMSDRCAANHAALKLVASTWEQPINELNCHLHPLDSMATAARSALKSEELDKGRLFGKDCFAANLVLQLNKLRYKDGKGDPRGFKTFLDDHKLPRGIIPRYRGNRLHILFHLCGIYAEHHSTFVTYLQTGTSCGGLRSSVLQDFGTTCARVEMQVLGLLGKVLTGPWMTTFYVSAESTVTHVGGIAIVRNVIEAMRAFMNRPEDVLHTQLDCFGKKLGVSSTLKALQQEPLDKPLFGRMMSATLRALIVVLERQYHRYFDMEISEQLLSDTSSARLHNIDAEEIMGMFSAAQQKSPNATLCYLSSKMRAQKNNTMHYLEDMDASQRKHVLKVVVPLARKIRSRRKARQSEIRTELSKRQAVKVQARETTERRKLEKRLKDMDLEKLSEQLPECDAVKCDAVRKLLSGEAAGTKICHMWSEDGHLLMYNGKIEKWKPRKRLYSVAYWSSEECYEDATDYEMSSVALAADTIHDDLVMSDF